MNNGRRIPVWAYIVAASFLLPTLGLLGKIGWAWASRVEDTRMCVAKQEEKITAQDERIKKLESNLEDIKNGVDLLIKMHMRTDASRTTSR